MTDADVNIHPSMDVILGKKHYTKHKTEMSIEVSQPSRDKRVKLLSVNEQSLNTYVATDSIDSHVKTGRNVTASVYSIKAATTTKQSPSFILPQPFIRASKSCENLYRNESFRVRDIRSEVEPIKQKKISIKTLKRQKTHVDENTGYKSNHKIESYFEQRVGLLKNTDLSLPNCDVGNNREDTGMEYNFEDYIPERKWSLPLNVRKPTNRHRYSENHRDIRAERFQSRQTVRLRDEQNDDGYESPGTMSSDLTPVSSASTSSFALNSSASEDSPKLEYSDQRDDFGYSKSEHTNIPLSNPIEAFEDAYQGAVSDHVTEQMISMDADGEKKSLKTNFGYVDISRIPSFKRMNENLRVRKPRSNNRRHSDGPSDIEQKLRQIVLNEDQSSIEENRETCSGNAYDRWKSYPSMNEHLNSFENGYRSDLVSNSSENGHSDTNFNWQELVCHTPPPGPGANESRHTDQQHYNYRNIARDCINNPNSQPPSIDYVQCSQDATTVYCSQAANKVHCTCAACYKNLISGQGNVDGDNCKCCSCRGGHSQSGLGHKSASVATTNGFVKPVTKFQASASEPNLSSKQIDPPKKVRFELDLDGNMKHTTYFFNKETHSPIDVKHHSVVHRDDVRANDESTSGIDLNESDTSMDSPAPSPYIEIHPASAKLVISRTNPGTGIVSQSSYQYIPYKGPCESGTNAPPEKTLNENGCENFCTNVNNMDKKQNYMEYSAKQTSENGICERPPVNRPDLNPCPPTHKAYSCPNFIRRSSDVLGAPINLSSIGPHINSSSIGDSTVTANANSNRDDIPVLYHNSTAYSGLTYSQKIDNYGDDNGITFQTDEARNFDSDSLTNSSHTSLSASEPITVLKNGDIQNTTSAVENHHENALRLYRTRGPPPPYSAHKLRRNSAIIPRPVTEKAARPSSALLPQDFNAFLHSPQHSLDNTSTASPSSHLTQSRSGQDEDFVTNDSNSEHFPANGAKPEFQQINPTINDPDALTQSVRNGYHKQERFSLYSDRLTAQPNTPESNLVRSTSNQDFRGQISGQNGFTRTRKPMFASSRDIYKLLEEQRRNPLANHAQSPYKHFAESSL